MNYPGYTLVRREDCPEQHGVLTVLNHDVSGATVLLVENEDTNKAFGIGFGTFPSDDTGVFHILEHSGGQREVPRDLAFFTAAQEQHGLLPERHDLPGQDRVSLCHPQRD